MAIIINGLLVSVKKSAGGMNFYKRTGVQCLRNKPQRSASYVSTPAQVAQQEIFGVVSNISKSSAIMSWVMQNGFSRGASGKGQTVYNTWSQKLLKSVSRGPDGQPLAASDREANRTAIKTDAMAYYAENMPLTQSKFKNFQLQIEKGAAADSAVVNITQDEIDAYRTYLTAQNQYFNDELAPALVIMPRNYTGEGAPPMSIIAPGAAVAGVYTYTLPAGTAAGDIIAIATAWYGWTPTAQNYGLTDASLSNSLDYIVPSLS